MAGPRTHAGAASRSAASAALCRRSSSTTGEWSGTSCRDRSVFGSSNGSARSTLHPDMPGRQVHIAPVQRERLAAPQASAEH
jgi:hypothetical protein